MYHSRKRVVRGFSLVELLVAMVIALIGSIIIFQVYAGFENQRRTTTSGSDATTNLAAATNALEQAAREAGYGLNFTSHMGCDAIGWRENADPSIMPHMPGAIFAQKLTPVSMTRTAGGMLDSLTFSRNTNDNAYSVTQLRSPMLPNSPPTATSTEDMLCLENNYGIAKGDILVLAEKKDKSDPLGLKTNKITCAVTEVRDFVTDTAKCKNRLIVHTYGDFISEDLQDTGTKYTFFNKGGGLGSIPDSGPVGSATALNSLDSVLDSPARDAPKLFTFSAGAYVMNLGPKVNGTSGLRSSTFTLRNGELRVSPFPGDPGIPLVDGIVFMDAQFGMASSKTSTSAALTYMNTLPETPANDPKIAQDTWFSLRTIRMVMIVKSSQYDKDYDVCARPVTATPTACTLSAMSRVAMPSWTPALTPYTVPATDVRYRHTVIELVIPLRNMIWRPT
jgi:type IV pilus assembly protein PilW